MCENESLKLNKRDKYKNSEGSVLLSMFMGSNGNAYYCPRWLAPGYAQPNIYTSKVNNTILIHPIRRCGMAVNMEHSIRYFQNNTFPYILNLLRYTNEILTE
jgi:hypothetical protein